MSYWVTTLGLLALQVALAAGVIYIAIRIMRHSRSQAEATLEVLHEFRLTLQDLARIEPEHAETYQFALSRCDDLEKGMRRLSRAAMPWKRPGR